MILLVFFFLGLLVLAGIALAGVVAFAVTCCLIVARIARAIFSVRVEKP